MNPSGLPKDIIDGLGYRLSLARIKNDIQSDFIYAPHISAIYSLAGKELWERLSSKLRSGTFQADLPISLDIPKASGFTRVGSILYPYERLAYQIIIDGIAPVAEKYLNRRRVYSHRFLKNDSSGFMFEPAGDCYSAYRDKIIKHCENRKFSYVFRADVVSHFQNINQHYLISSLRNAECDSSLLNFLEKLILRFTANISRGIIQGVFPSDFLGNFSLCPIDNHLIFNGVPFVRYVDDMVMFFPTERKAQFYKIQTSKWLREEGLDLNEAKTKILPKNIFFKEETEVERMFEDAKEELGDDFEREDFYRSTISWDFDPSGLVEDIGLQDDDIELNATISLFEITDVEDITRDKIDKFCLSIFIAANKDCAFNHVIRNYSHRPHMSQFFAKYLKNVISNDQSCAKYVEKIIFDKKMIFDFQYIWLYAALINANRINKRTVDLTIKQMKNANLSEALRAVCSILIGKFGNSIQKRFLRSHYAQEQSHYVKSAILYGARYFSTPEKNACFRAWGGHNELNSLVVFAAKRIS